MSQTLIYILIAVIAIAAGVASWRYFTVRWGKNKEDWEEGSRR